MLDKKDFKNFSEEKQSAQMLANQEEASTFSQAVLSTPPAKLKKKKARKSRWSNGFVSKPNRKLKPKDTSDKDDENSEHNNDGSDTDEPDTTLNDSKDLKVKKMNILTYLPCFYVAPISRKKKTPDLFRTLIN